MARKSFVTYVLVAPCIPLFNSGHEAYTYHVPENVQIEENTVVRISFGKRKILGVVLQIGIRRPQYPTKVVTSILDTVLTSHQMQFAKEIAGLAHGGLGFTLRLFVPDSL